MIGSSRTVGHDREQAVGVSLYGEPVELVRWLRR